MKIPFLDLHGAYTELKPEFDAAWMRVMESGRYLLGTELDSFEREYAQYCGTAGCVGVGSGLDALHLVLRAWGIGTGDEVIVPSHTFIATWLAVSATGARPVPVEPDPDTGNMAPAGIESAINGRTKAIIPVHLYGQPADLEPIMALAERHGIRVLEDAAQAQGARYRGRRVGSLAHAAAHSFYPGKNLGAFSDAGAVTTNDTQLEFKLRQLRNYGSSLKYHHECWGTNSRMDELQAACLRVRLRHLDDWNCRRQRIANRYLSRLQPSARADGAGESSLRLPSVPSWAEPVWHLFVVRHPNRASLQLALKDKDIETLIHYPIPPHASGTYRYLGLGVDSQPIANDFASSVLSLPIGPHLQEAQAEKVIEEVKTWLAGEIATP